MRVETGCGPPQLTPIATQSALPQPPEMSAETGNQIIEAVEGTSLLLADGGFAVSYFNLEFNPEMATSLVHTLNRPYKGAHKFSTTAPDAQGTLLIWARDPQECREHLLNALFDLIFARNRVGAAVFNPPCIFCGGKTHSRGRNSSGTRAWRCMNPGCQRSFVIDRSFRGGIHHPTQSKKPEFHRLVFVEGNTIREACDALGISMSAGDNWYQKMLAVRKRIDHKCPCGKELRHRGACRFRQEYQITREDKAHDKNRTTDRSRDGGQITRKAPAG